MKKYIFLVIILLITITAVNAGDSSSWTKIYVNGSQFNIPPEFDEFGEYYPDEYGGWDYYIPELSNEKIYCKMFILKEDLSSNNYIDSAESFKSNFAISCLDNDLADVYGYLMHFRPQNALFEDINVAGHEARHFVSDYNQDGPRSYLFFEAGGKIYYVKWPGYEVNETITNIIKDTAASTLDVETFHSKLDASQNLFEERMNNGTAYNHDWVKIHTDNAEFAIPPRYSDGDYINEENSWKMNYKNELTDIHSNSYRWLHNHSKTNDKEFEITQLSDSDLKYTYGQLKHYTPYYSLTENTTIAGHDVIHIVSDYQYKGSSLSGDYSHYFFAAGDKIYHIKYPGSNINPYVESIFYNVPDSSYTLSQLQSILDEYAQKYEDEMNSGDEYYIYEPRYSTKNRNFIFF